MSITTEIKTRETPLDITYQPLPDNYQLEDEPVEHTGQPLIAGILREILELMGYITSEMLIASNFGLCVTVNKKLVIKAPDWVYVPKVAPLAIVKDRKSYTPNLEGENPAVVMEFVSTRNEDEYDKKSTYPYGKWYFYEKILKVPIYVIFYPADGTLEVYHLIGEEYQLMAANERGLYWIESMKLYLGVWLGIKEERAGFWLRWWDIGINMLPTAVESLAQERLKAELERALAEEMLNQERLKAEEMLNQERLKAQQAELERALAEEKLTQERLKAEKLAEYLRNFGINPDDIL